MPQRRLKPLAGRVVVITRKQGQAESSREALRKLGARVVELPTIALVPPASWNQVDQAIERLDRYHWVIFTSANGVERFFQRLGKHRVEPALSGRKVAAIGPATARVLRRHGVRAAVVPGEFRAEGLLAALKDKHWRGKRVLLARAAEAREILPRELRRRGAKVDVVTVYRTVLPQASRQLAKKVFAGRRPDAIAFTSSSTVKNFFALHGKGWARRALDGVAVATIGPVTSGTARKLGLRVAAEANPYTLLALAQALAEHFRSEWRHGGRQVDSSRRVE